LEEFSTAEKLPGDKFEEIMSVSKKIVKKINELYFLTL